MSQVLGFGCVLLALVPTLFAEQNVVLHAGALGLRESAVVAPLPDYPTESVRARREGRVVVRIIVKTDGTVGSINFLERSDELMASAVAAALKRWRFIPAAEEGKRAGIPCRGPVDVLFLDY